MTKTWRFALLAVLLVAIVVAVLLVCRGTDSRDPIGGQAVRSGSTPQNSLPTGSSQAPPGPGARYVHMGDSYGAGTGPLNLVKGAPVPCQRTTVNPARQLARKMRWQLTDVSCASAKTENLSVEQYFGAGPQLDALSSETQVVTVVMGANDEDFFDTLVTKCANLGRQDPSGSPCRDAYGEFFRSSLRVGTGPNLKKAFRDIAGKAPNAQLFAAGYPWLTPATGDCRPALRFADGDISFAREMQELLNEQVRLGVESVGGTYVDMAERSEGHDACAPADVRWIEPAFNADTGQPTGLSANHPNSAGQRAIAEAFAASIRAQR